MSRFENMSLTQRALFGSAAAIGALTAGSAIEAGAHNAYIGAEVTCSDGIGADSQPEGRVYPSGFSDSIGNIITLKDNGTPIDSHLVTVDNLDESYTFQLASGNHSLVLSWENNPGGTQPITGFLPECDTPTTTTAPAETTTTTAAPETTTTTAPAETSTSTTIVEETTTTAPAETTSTTAAPEVTTTTTSIESTTTSTTEAATTTTSTAPAETTTTAPAETSTSTTVTVTTPSTTTPAKTPPTNVLPPTGTESLKLRDLATYFVMAGYSIMRLVRRPLRAVRSAR